MMLLQDDFQIQLDQPDVASEGNVGFRDARVAPMGTDPASVPRAAGPSINGWQPRGIQNNYTIGQPLMPVSSMGRPLYVPAGEE